MFGVAGSCLFVWYLRVVVVDVCCCFWVVFGFVVVCVFVVVGSCLCVFVSVCCCWFVIGVVCL